MVCLRLHCCLIILGSVYPDIYTEHDPQRNLALGKPTSQIDTFDFWTNKGYWHNGSSHNAVDGNFETDHQNKTCMRTDKHELTWWMVDLQDYYVISDIVVMVIDFAFEELNLTIEISMFWDDEAKQLIDPEFCYHHGDLLPRKIRSVMPCRSKILGRFVRFTRFKPGGRRFSMCQVEVYGSKTERFFSVERRRGRRSKGRRLEKILTSSPVYCTDRCAKRLECTSFNMAEKETECELMADDVIDIDGNEESATGWVRHIFH